MAEERISYEMLQDLVRAERRSNRLSPVQARFWAELRAFLEDIKAGFREEQQKDPFGRRAMMARDEAQHAIQAAETLWSLRERKMALYALAQPKQGDTERPDGLTMEELDLYDAFVASLRAGKAKVFGEAAPSVAPPAKVRSSRPGDQAPPSPAPAPMPAVPASTTTGPAPGAEPAKPLPPTGSEPLPPDLHEPPQEAPEPDREPTPDAVPDTAPAPPRSPSPPTTVPADTPTSEMVTIRALGDIPPFVGPDMQTYLLREGDLATVPPAIARLLEKRGKAEIMQA